MKENLNKQKKQLRELSDEELQNVTGGVKKHVNIRDGREFDMACKILSCPPGYKLDTSLQPCQCVEEPNAIVK